MKQHLHSYTAYSIGCAIVCVAILLAAATREDRSVLRRLRMVCGGWWLGWLSASIARLVYPREAG